MGKLRLRLVVALGALATAMFVGACGGDDDDDDSGGEAASATDVTVTAKEYSFDLSATPTADTEKVALQTAEVKGPLEPGSYAMVCPIPAGGGKTHYDLGQVQEFDIE